MQKIKNIYIYNEDRSTTTNESNITFLSSTHTNCFPH